jgi:hypothetical protein
VFFLEIAGASCRCRLFLQCLGTANHRFGLPSLFNFVKKANCRCLFLRKDFSQVPLLIPEQRTSTLTTGHPPLPFAALV